MRKGFALLGGWLLTAASGWAQAESPVVSTRWVSDGYTETSATEAEFWVTVTWVVPSAVRGSRTCYFKRAWRKQEEHTDGSLHTLIDGGNVVHGVCGDGPGGGSTSSVMMRTDDNGPQVDLSVSWQMGKNKGAIEQHLSLPWSKLKRTVREKDATISLDVYWPKKP